MKILVLSDLHANNENLGKLDKEFAQADAVIFAGDFAECFKPETGKEALNTLCTRHDTIFAVLGNCDEPEFIEELEDQDICVEKTLVFHEGLAFAGSGGGTYFTGKTANEREEAEILSDFNIVKNSVEQTGDQSLWKSLILISHNPPKNTKCDAVNAELHAGSQMFTDFIKENQPLAVVCGHIHEGKAVDKIGDTVVINPGPLQEGNYAWLEVEKAGDGWKVSKTDLCSL
ncbi:metallophosphoesterase [Treponema sp. C6A8]|uniref:metallophosphoesterase family protein n=1 Tax=Treponema sp. C6A8 TaxID=1410609 RepID=UPI000482A5A8|nr:metallophosphoesterase [Treponema sp. C6A8]